jgi:hypothetical protein
LSTFLGLKVCADIKLPQPSRSAPFPMLNGQGIFSLSIEKSESSMEGYYMKIEKDNKGTYTTQLSIVNLKQIVQHIHYLKYLQMRTTVGFLFIWILLDLVPTEKSLPLLKHLSTNLPPLNIFSNWSHPGQSLTWITNDLSLIN